MSRCRGLFVVAAAVLLAACSGDGAREDEPGDVTFDEPAAYEITYEITDAEGAVTTEEVAVRRPWVAEQVLFDGGEEVSSSRTALGRLLLPEGVLAIAPALGGVDLRLAPVLDAALADGLLEAGEEKTVAGRRCRVYRAGTSVIAGELAPGGPTEASYADACFDAAGLLLEERWVVDGDLLRTKVATSVAVDDAGALGESWADEPTTLPGGGGSFSVLDAPVVEAEPPEGFERLGAFRTELPAIAGSRTTSSEVWTRGIDVLIVEIGPALDDALEPFVVTLRGVEARRDLGDGRLLRVIGTLAPDDVRAFAASVSVLDGD
jgi:hypothetical protein